MMQNSVRSAMTKEPISIGPEVELMDAMEIMRSWGMRHLPVTARNGEIIGVLSERDALRYMANHPAEVATVRLAMIDEPYVVEPSDLLANIAATMAQNKYGCAIVAGKGGICGIFTTTDSLRILAQILREPEGQGFKVMKIEEYLKARGAAA